MVLWANILLKVSKNKFFDIKGIIIPDENKFIN